MKNFFIAWGIAFPILFAVLWLAVVTDSVLNPWIIPSTADWKWYTYLSNRHAWTALYFTHFHLWLLAVMVASAAVAEYFAKKAQ